MSMTPVTIAGRPVGPGHPPWVVAEAGSNHDRDLATALALVDAAAGAGCDAVKFQLFTADRIAARTDHGAARLTGEVARWAADLHGLYARCELPPGFLRPLQARARERGIAFLCSTFDEASTDALVDLGVAALKVASFELGHLKLLRHAAATGLPLILSTGMADLEEVADAVTAVRQGATEGRGDGGVVLLHCVSAYPAPPDDVHLASMDLLATRFGVPAGYSDHTEGIAVAIAAAARGACLIEKHFTLDRRRDGPDHPFAAEPAELAALVAGVRAAFAATRPGRKDASPSERENRWRGRRSLFLRADLPAGTRLEERHLDVLRPGCGLPPRLASTVLGWRLTRAVCAGEPLTWDLLVVDDDARPVRDPTRAAAAPPRHGEAVHG